MTPEEIKQRGDLAQILLNDPTLNQAFDDVRDLYIKQIEQSDFSQTKQREEAYRMLRALESLKGMIARYVRDADNVAARESISVVKRLAEED